MMYQHPKGKGKGAPQPAKSKGKGMPRPSPKGKGKGGKGKGGKPGPMHPYTTAALNAGAVLPVGPVPAYRPNGVAPMPVVAGPRRLVRGNSMPPAMNRNGSLPPGYVYTGKRVATPNNYTQKPMVATEPTPLPAKFQSVDTTIPMSVPHKHVEIIDNGIAVHGVHTADVQVVRRNTVSVPSVVRHDVVSASYAKAPIVRSATAAPSVLRKEPMMYNGKKYTGVDLSVGGTERLGQERRSDWYADNHGNTDAPYPALLQRSQSDVDFYGPPVAVGTSATFSEGVYREPQYGVSATKEPPMPAEVVEQPDRGRALSRMDTSGPDATDQKGFDPYTGLYRSTSKAPPQRSATVEPTPSYIHDQQNEQHAAVTHHGEYVPTGDKTRQADGSWSQSVEKVPVYTQSGEGYGPDTENKEYDRSTGTYRARSASPAPRSSTTAGSEDQFDKNHSFSKRELFNKDMRQDSMKPPTFGADSKSELLHSDLIFKSHAAYQNQVPIPKGDSFGFKSPCFVRGGAKVVNPGSLDQTFDGSKPKPNNDLHVSTSDYKRQLTAQGLIADDDVEFLDNQNKFDEHDHQAAYARPGKAQYDDGYAHMRAGRSEEVHGSKSPVPRSASAEPSSSRREGSILSEPEPTPRADGSVISNASNQSFLKKMMAKLGRSGGGGDEASTPARSPARKEPNQPDFEDVRRLERIPESHNTSDNDGNWGQHQFAASVGASAAPRVQEPAGKKDNTPLNRKSTGVPMGNQFDPSSGSAQKVQRRDTAAPMGNNFSPAEEQQNKVDRRSTGLPFGSYVNPENMSAVSSSGVARRRTPTPDRSRVIRDSSLAPPERTPQQKEHTAQFQQSHQQREEQARQMRMLQSQAPSQEERGAQQAHQMRMLQTQTSSHDQAVRNVFANAAQSTPESYDPNRYALPSESMPSHDDVNRDRRQSYNSAMHPEPFADFPTDSLVGEFDVSASVPPHGYDCYDGGAAVGEFRPSQEIFHQGQVSNQSSGRSFRSQSPSAGTPSGLGGKVKSMWKTITFSRGPSEKELAEREASRREWRQSCGLVDSNDHPAGGFRTSASLPPRDHKFDDREHKYGESDFASPSSPPFKRSATAQESLSAIAGDHHSQCSSKMYQRAGPAARFSRQKSGATWETEQKMHAEARKSDELRSSLKTIPASVAQAKKKVTIVDSSSSSDDGETDGGIYSMSEYETDNEAPQVKIPLWKQKMLARQGKPLPNGQGPLVKAAAATPPRGFQAAATPPKPAPRGFQAQAPPPTSYDYTHSSSNESSRPNLEQNNNSTQNNYQQRSSQYGSYDSLDANIDTQNKYNDQRGSVVKSDRGSVVSDFNFETARPGELPYPYNTEEYRQQQFDNYNRSTNENGRSEPISPPSHEWHPGSKAMAQNLQQDKHLNGKMCTVEKVCERGYVHVFFDDVELQRNGNKGKWKLSGKNLMPVMAMFDDDSEDEGQFGSDDESDDEEVIQKMNEIENAPTKAGEKTGSSLEVSVRCSPKKTDIMSLPKIGRKMGKKAHLWAVTVGNETFYARRTALVKCKLIKNKELTHGKIKKKITKRLQEAGETRGKAMMQLAERITFQEQNANLWVMMHFGSLF